LNGTLWIVASATVKGNLPFRLQPGEFLVGRTASAQVVVADPTVSRRHARLSNTGRSVTVTDLKSCNGTFVNDQPVEKAALHVGDRIRFGAIACAVVRSPLAVGGEDTESTNPIPHWAEPQQIEGLTSAQSLIAGQLLEGRSESEIAQLLGKSPHTIHTHVKSIFQRLGVHTRAELILALLKNRTSPIPLKTKGPGVLE
jgi:DNA-binding CsgD family transcriptional regulator